MSRLTERIDEVSYNGYRWVLAPLGWAFAVFGLFLLLSLAVEKAAMYLN